MFWDYSPKTFDIFCKIRHSFIWQGKFVYGWEQLFLGDTALCMNTFQKIYINGFHLRYDVIVDIQSA